MLSSCCHKSVSVLEPVLCHQQGSSFLQAPHTRRWVMAPSSPCGVGELTLVQGRLGPEGLQGSASPYCSPNHDGILMKVLPQLCVIGNPDEPF